MATVFAWWRIHRPAGRKIVVTEAREAKRILGRFPEIGEIDRGRGGEIRRLLLPRSGYFVFYRVDHGARRVDVLAFWSAQRLPPAL
jgi:plasmid stabilization system protein ParE